MNAVQFALDYIYDYGHYKEKHPHYKGYKFSRLHPSSKIPVPALYRGVYFETKEAFETAKQQIQAGTFQTEELTSWSISKDVAMQFPLTRWVKNGKAGYGGMIIKAKEVKPNQILFDSLLAHYAFEREGLTIPSAKPYLDEAELVLKPTPLEVEIVLDYDFQSLLILYTEQKQKEIVSH